MKIKTINIPREDANYEIEDIGLSNIKMEKLQDIVILAGKNGSGKTRILDRIFNFVQTSPTQSTILNIYDEINTYISFIDQLKKNNENNKNQLGIKSYEGEIKKREKLIFFHNSLECENEIEDKNKIIRFVPQSLKLIDPNSQNRDQLFSRAKQVNESIGISNMSDNALFAIQLIQDKHFNATHQFYATNLLEKDTATNDYNNLNKIIYAFLGVNLDRDINGNATLFGFKIGDAKLSDGQKVLLQLCVAIYAQNAKLSDLIIMMDEPENHLHPSVIIETIDRIRECIPKGQIWIATHSIPILAHYGSKYIYFVENGHIQYAGNIPEKVLESLLGDEEEKYKLIDFISLPEQLAMTNFAHECLFAPKAISTGNTDPQTNQIRDALTQLLTERGKIKILDFGAGKGRLLSNMLENGDNLNKFDYIAYDKYDDDSDCCKDVIKSAYKDNYTERYFNKIYDILTPHEKGSFDVIVFCNVLHEIEPKEWIQIFEKGGELSQLLKEDGYLLLVEDMQLSFGEKAHSKGFILLDTPELKTLFKSKIEEFIISSIKNDRLKAHLIPKTSIIRIDSDSRKAALNEIRDKAKNKIKEIRENDKRDYKTGRSHALWSQLLANSILALEEL